VRNAKANARPNRLQAPGKKTSAFAVVPQDLEPQHGVLEALSSSPGSGFVFGLQAEFAKALTAECIARMKVFGESFDSSVFYDPEKDSIRSDPESRT
jgi:hypothetical protein